MDIADQQSLRIRYIQTMSDAPEISTLEDLTPGELLRRTRIRHELSQEQLAIRSGTTQSAIARIERDRVSPSIKTLTAFLQAMEEDFVFGSRRRDWGVDYTLNQRNEQFDTTGRIERGLGFSDVIREIRGEKTKQRAA
jgi:transcriptional regulator with XRE-family HTH domain